MRTDAAMLLGSTRFLFVVFVLCERGALVQMESKSCVSERTQKDGTTTDLQVMVMNSTFEETTFITLTCSATCSLTETPLYIWYKDGEVVHRDSDPWYPVPSKDTGSRYSCAVQGNQTLRSPAVSVDFVSRKCFKVTYVGGTNCPSTNQTCSFTFPRELWVNVTVQTTGQATLTCNSSCDLTENPTPTYTWYKGKEPQTETSSQLKVSISSTNSYSCSSAGSEIRSPSVCPGEKKNCWSVNYVTKRICAVKGSSVNMSCSYTYPTANEIPKTFWYNKWPENKPNPDELFLDGGRLKYNKIDNEHSLSITGLEESDSAEYSFRIRFNNEKYAGIPGVILNITGLQVKVAPSRVAEGQRVTLTCSTTCPLPGDLTYVWYRNRRPLTQEEAQQKSLHVNPVRSEDHGSSFSCAVKNHEGLRSSEETLMVRYAPKWPSLSVRPPGGEIVAGSSVTLTCSSDANPPVNTYTWYKENTPGSISSGQNYTITNFSSKDAGYYLCMAMNEEGSKNSSSLLINTTGESTLVKIVLMAGFSILLLVLLIITLYLCRRKRNHKSTVDPANSIQADPAPNGVSSLPIPRAEGVNPEPQCASIDFSQPRNQEGPAHGILRQREAPDGEEEIQYATVNFTRPYAAPSVKTEDPSVVYSTVRQGR